DTNLPANLTTNLSGSALPEQLLTVPPPPAGAPSLLLSAVLSVPFTATASSGGGTGGSTPSGGEAADLRASDLLPSLLADQAPPFELPTEKDVLSGMDIAGSLLTGTPPRAQLALGRRNTVTPVGALAPGEAEERAGPRSEAAPEVGLDVPLQIN